VRIEPLEGSEAEAFCNRSPFSLVGDKIEPLAVTDLIQPEMMGETIGH
jgi:hypothetical protein